MSSDIEYKLKKLLECHTKQTNVNNTPLFGDTTYPLLIAEVGLPNFGTWYSQCLTSTSQRYRGTSNPYYYGGSTANFQTGVLEGTGTSAFVKELHLKGSITALPLKWEWPYTQPTHPNLRRIIVCFHNPGNPYRDPNNDLAWLPYINTVLETPNTMSLYVKKNNVLRHTVIDDKTFHFNPGYYDFYADEKAPIGNHTTTDMDEVIPINKLVKFAAPVITGLGVNGGHFDEGSGTKVRGQVSENLLMMYWIFDNVAYTSDFEQIPFTCTTNCQLTYRF